MGCDIHIWAERKTADGYEPITDVQFAEGSAPFDWRSYGMYGFLADIRNYSAIQPIAERRGFPEDASHDAAEDYHDYWGVDAHSPSWLTVQELTAFDYDQPLEDRRVMRNNNGGSTCDPGEGEMTTYRAFLGVQFFADLEKLAACGADRVVFWFDN